MKLQDKVFIVTGAGSGIGKELVLGLLEKGARVAAIDRSADSLNSLKNELNNTEPNLSVHIVDIADKGAVEQLPNQVLAIHQQIDGVINCAGIIQPFVKVQDLDYEAVERVMRVNFYGTLYMVKSHLPYLLKRPEAYIVNFSSMGGFLPVPGQSIYGASKAAVKLLTEGLYAELLGSSVHVSVVFPGATQTNITENSGVVVPNMEQAKASAGKVPMLSAAEAAQIVIAGIEKNKPRIFTGKDSKFMNFLYTIRPVYATRFIAKKMQSLLG